MITSEDIRQLAAYCEATLDLAAAAAKEPEYYQSLPLCVIDAVFSIGVRYAAVTNVIERFCERFGLASFAKTKYPPRERQMSISAFIDIYDQYGLERMTDEVYQNRQRTSTRSGILKAEAVLSFSKVLQRHEVNYLQDVKRVIGDPTFEGEIRAIPGQGSGISLRYFYMLAGSGDYIKPDRMVSRFIEVALGKKLGIEAMHEVLVAAHERLISKYPDLTLGALDNCIWRYQRTQ